MRQSALDANFRRVQFPGFRRFLRHLVETEEISIVFARPPAERAEFATHETDVREIDIAVDHIGNKISRQLRAQRPGGLLRPRTAAL